jgi:hypothetical protein
MFGTPGIKPSTSKYNTGYLLNISSDLLISRPDWIFIGKLTESFIFLFLVIKNINKRYKYSLDLNKS